MPKLATVHQKESFRRRMSEGWGVKASAIAVGMSENWGHDQRRKDKAAESAREQAQKELEGEHPKRLEDLDPLARECLGDFLLWREVFMCRRRVAWAKDAAERAVDWLTEYSEETYAVENMPPGAGKTVLFTHDLVAWLICGGGRKDPAWGRALRIMLGSETKHVSKHFVTSLRNTFERNNPFYDKVQKRQAEMTLKQAYGRFKPLKTLGEYSLWRDDQFTVAQIGELEIYDKEPTVQAASREGGFLGDRVDLAVWDDLVTKKNCRSADAADELESWFEDQAESRIEPGGVLFLVGQRLGNLDLYRKRLDARFTDLSGDERQVYERVIYPAHNEANCLHGGLSESCTEWDGDAGCLLDASRLHPYALAKARSKGNFATVYQQTDANPEDLLVQPAWIYGGVDSEGFEADGCLDHDRGFFEWPDVPGLIDVMAVDPSVSGWWAMEWWAVEPIEPHRAWLIWGQRKKMLAGTDNGFLDYNPHTKELVGEMPRMQKLSGDLGHPLKGWIVEQNAAHKYLFGTHAFKTYRTAWPKVFVMKHSTQTNKIHDDFGVGALIPQAYKLALARLPYKPGIEMRNYLKVKIDELTKYPEYSTDDTVMANWFVLNRQQQILRHAKAYLRTDFGNDDQPGVPAFQKAMAG